MKKEWNSWNSR